MLHNLSFDARYFLTLNVWINKQEQFFLTIIAYYIIEAWLYKKIHLNFKSFLYQHTEWEMINVMLKLLRQYFIESRLLTITNDNVSLNETLRIHFDALLSEHCNFVWNHQKNIIRCIIHVIQLMLRVIFKTLKVSFVIDKEMNRSMMFNNIRKNISWVNTIVKINLYITFNYHVNIR